MFLNAIPEAVFKYLSNFTASSLEWKPEHQISFTGFKSLVAKHSPKLWSWILHFKSLVNPEYRELFFNLRIYTNHILAHSSLKFRRASSQFYYGVYPSKPWRRRVVERIRTANRLSHIQVRCHCATTTTLYLADHSLDPPHYFSM